MAWRSLASCCRILVSASGALRRAFHAGLSIPWRVSDRVFMESALGQKESGNGLFAKGRYQEALEAYTSGLQHLEAQVRALQRSDCPFGF
jgi:hypothetical protein